LTAVTLFLSCVYSGVLTNKPRWGDNPLVHSSTTNTQSQVISQTSCMKTHSVRVNIIYLYNFLRFCRIKFDVVFSAKFHILGLSHGNWKKIYLYYNVQGHTRWYMCKHGYRKLCEIYYPVWIDQHMCSLWSIIFIDFA
jgi:hypothetical protein